MPLHVNFQRVLHCMTVHLYLYQEQVKTWVNQGENLVKMGPVSENGGAEASGEGLASDASGA